MSGSSTFAARRRAGLCVGCGERRPLEGVRCVECAVEHREECRRAYRARKGLPMEPVCKLPNGAMRDWHVFDDDGLCACGAKEDQRPAISPAAIRQMAADKLTRKRGHGSPTREQRIAFGQGGLAIPADPLAAAIARLERIRDEADAAIVTLRLHVRRESTKASA